MYMHKLLACKNNEIYPNEAVLLKSIFSFPKNNFPEIQKTHAIKSSESSKFIHDQ